jgi:hypothetical protein
VQGEGVRKWEKGLAREASLNEQLHAAVAKLEFR